VETRESATEIQSNRSQKSFSLLYPMMGNQIDVSIGNWNSHNINIDTGNKNHIKYDGKEIFEVNLLDYFTFKGNSFFVDKTLAGPFVQSTLINQ
jgi:hypothetical protein